MKNVAKAAFILGVTSLSIMGCKRETIQPQTNEIAKETLDKIYNMGFGTSNVQKHEDGYLVEGDIVLTEEQLNSQHTAQFLRVGNAEQYRTTNLVKAGTGRTITVSISSKLPASYVAALDEAVARYNAEKLSLKFQRVSSGGNIQLVSGTGSYLASAGFPTSTGDPYNQVKVNSRSIGSQPQSTVASILAHEMGHCIGFRHTDYMDRSYSCGGAYSNEGASTVGAINVPGTPTAADPNSWMLACIGSGMNRPFNANDKTALNYLY